MSERAVPDYIQPLVGWRLFSIYWYKNEGEDFYRHFLGPTSVVKCYSAIGPCPQPPVLEKAECYQGHDAPNETCGCGFYAYHTPSHMIAFHNVLTLDVLIHAFSAPRQSSRREPGYLLPAPAHGAAWPARAAILALVQGYGEVIYHNNLWRAEYMRIAAFCGDGKYTGPMAEEHGLNLDVPVMTLEEMREYAEYAGECLERR